MQNANQIVTVLSLRTTVLVCDFMNMELYNRLQLHDRYRGWPNEISQTKNCRMNDEKSIRVTRKV